MKSLIATYDSYLKKRAEVAPAKRLWVNQQVMFPWVVAAIGACLLASLLPGGFGDWLVISALCVGAAGALYAALRVAKYGAQFDRTPKAGWAETPGGAALAQALRRVTLNNLSDVTSTTRLRGDLKLSAADMSALLGVLAAEQWQVSVEGAPPEDFTVEALLRLAPA